MIVTLILWILKSIFLLGLLHFCVPVAVHAVTLNSWWKLPVLLILGILAGVLMAWMHYVPYLLIFVWLALTHHTLAATFKPEFQEQFEETNGQPINKAVFRVSIYAYVIVACVSAYFFQTDIVREGASGRVVVPLWSALLHGAPGGP